MELFTTLTMIKMRLNGGEAPAMTPLTDRAKEICDPDFTPGMGALEADVETTKLRCPVQGCGKFYHRLEKHLNAVHDDIGGADRVRRALDIGRNTTLASENESNREQYTPRETDPRRCEHTDDDGGRCRSWKWSGSDTLCYFHDESTIEQRKNSCKRGRESAASTVKTVGFRNLHNSCDAQLSQRILSLRDKLRRTPSTTDARKEDPGLYSAAAHYYGSWTAALAALDMKARTGAPPEITRRQICTMVRAFYDEHGRLPTSTEAHQPTIPKLPSNTTIKKTLGADNWPQAMRIMATLLKVPAGEYGELGLNRPIDSYEAAKILGMSRAGARGLLMANGHKTEKRTVPGRGPVRFFEKEEVEAMAQERAPA